MERITSLITGKINEIQINLGQGLLYDQTADQIYLVNFEDDEHTVIQKAVVISFERASNLASQWLG